MYKLCNFNKNNLNHLERLNYLRENFNKLNKDFIQVYKDANTLQQLLLKKRVKLLKKDVDYIGYIWFEYKSRNILNIKSMSVDTDLDLILAYAYLIKSIKYFSLISYECIQNRFNYSILEKLGFTKVKGLLQMKINLFKPYSLELKEGISFQKLIKGKNEPIRCYLQNEIFNKEDRIPLDIGDIFYDQIQDYYWDEGSIFMKKDNKYIGYGQIIIRDNCPNIVNFGILKPYQNKGYGNLFIKHLLNTIYLNGYTNADIKVDSYNIPAILLYRKVGFKEISEHSTWYLRR